MAKKNGYQKEEKMLGDLEECSHVHSGDSWPEPRSGHRMCANDNYLYVFGGFDPNRDNRLYNDLLRYNITTEKWVKLPDDGNCIPKLCLSSTMLLWQDRIIVFGGTGYPFAEKNSNKLYLYCLKSYQWIDLDTAVPRHSIPSQKNMSSSKHLCICDKRLITSESPAPKYGHSMALCERKGELYIFSGTKGRTFEDELHKFNFDRMTWDLVQFCVKHNEVPGPRYRHESVWNDKEFYIFGGSTLNEMFGNDTVYSFDFDKYEWKCHECCTNVSLDDSQQSSPRYPQPRKAHSCVLYGDVVYMIGGINEEDEMVYNDIWKFYLSKKMWIQSEVNFPHEVYFHSSAVTNQGCMYIFGGADSLDMRNNNMYKMWLCVPSLREQAWTKVIGLLKSKNNLNTDVLERLGIPKNLCSRLNDSCHKLTQAA